MKTLMAGVPGVALLGGGSFLAGDSQTGPDRPDCPGQIRCPQTGELVCEDRCPLLEEQAAEPQPAAACPLCR